MNILDTHYDFDSEFAHFTVEMGGEEYDIIIVVSVRDFFIDGLGFNYSINKVVDDECISIIHEPIDSFFGKYSSMKLSRELESVINDYYSNYGEHVF